jgi:hypothetical protein
MRPYSKRFERYDNDPAIKQLVSAGSALTVITLAPNREVLLEQFLKRAADPDDVEWWVRNRWTRQLKQKLRAAIYRLTGKQPKLLKEEQLRLLGVYASKNGLKQWLAEWESFLEGLRRGSPGVRLVYVTPEQLQHDFPRLRLFRLDQTRGRSGMATAPVDQKSQACACPNVRFEHQTERAHTLDAQPISSTPL